MVTESLLFGASTPILITRKVIRIQGEVYQFSNVTGFSFQELPPETIELAKDSTLPWLVILVSSVLYIFVFSASLDLSEAYTLFAYLLIIISIIKIAQIEGAPSFQKIPKYGLTLILNSGGSIVFPSYDKDKIIGIVEEIYAFMKDENDRGSVLIQYYYDSRMSIGELSIDQSQRTQNFNAPMSGIIGSEIKDNARVRGNSFSQRD